MVNIKPFPGVRFSDKVNLSKVLSPPYDVIKKEMLIDYYDRSEYNIAHIIVPDKEIKQVIQEWFDSGILVQDEESIYVYSETFKIGDDEKTRWSFIAIMELEEFGENVFPHENTFDDIVEDRYNLLKQTNMNIGQVLCMYFDPKNQIKDIVNLNEPIIDVECDNIRHKLWKISDTTIINKIISYMADKIVVIADGHHRYKAALKLKNKAGVAYRMVTFVNAYDPGLVIMPTHRKVKLGTEFLQKAKIYFKIKEVMKKELFGNIKKNVIGVYYDNRYFLFESKLKNQLDVTVLHNFLQKLNVDDKNIKYFRSMEELDKGDGALFFLSPVSVDTIKEYALSAKIMPQKTTYFYPKVYTGLVMYKVNGNA